MMRKKKRCAKTNESSLLLTQSKIPIFHFCSQTKKLASNKHVFRERSLSKPVRLTSEQRVYRILLTSYWHARIPPLLT